MTRACLLPVRAAIGDLFTDEEIEQFLVDLDARIQRLKHLRGVAGDDPELYNEAYETLAIERLEEHLIEARMRAAAATARARRQSFYAGFDGGEADALAALMVGDEREGARRGASVDALGKAAEVDAHSRFVRALQSAGQLGRLTSPWQLFAPDEAFEDEVARELARLNGEARGQSADADATRVAEILFADQQRTRAAMNRLGARIGDLPGYISRTTHDAMKIGGGFWRGLNAERRREARENWLSFVAPLLHERTFQRVDEEALANLRADLASDARLSDSDVEARLAEAADATIAASRRTFLTRVWTDIVSGYRGGRADPNDLDGFIPPSSLARQVSQPRVLHWRDADAWIAYNRQFGTGSLFLAHLSFLSRAARNEALMRQFGPSPEAAFSADVQRLTRQARDRGAVREVGALKSWRRQGEFDQLTGRAEAPESPRLAVMSRSIRAWTQLSKLGGMIFSSVTDLGAGAQALSRAGVAHLKTYGGLTGSVVNIADPVLRRETANLVGEGARAIAGDIAAQFTAPDAGLGLMFKASRVFYRLNLFSFWQARLRAGAAAILARHLGSRSSLAWGSLDAPSRGHLERYGIDEGAWELLRPFYGEIEGRVLTPDAVERIDGEALARWAGKRAFPEGYRAEDIEDARRELQLRFQAYFTDTIDNAMTEPRARERAMLRLGQHAGTPLGTALELITQFKGFPLTVLTRHLGPALAEAGARQSMAPLAHLFVSMTVLGYVAMTMKDLARGLEPQPFEDEEGNPNTGIFLRAFLQGGGAGLYGDFVFGDYDRFGRSPWAALGGPSVGEAERLLRIFGQARAGEFGEAGANAARAGLDNTPMINLFYTRWALNYLFLYQLQENLSPGYLERLEARVREERGGQDYWAPPSEALER